jgi:hypothetical protein
MVVCVTAYAPTGNDAPTAHDADANHTKPLTRYGRGWHAEVRRATETMMRTIRIAREGQRQMAHRIMRKQTATINIESDHHIEERDAGARNGMVLNS